VKFFNRIELILYTFYIRGKLQNLDNSAAVSHGILQSGLWNMAKFATENCGP